VSVKYQIHQHEENAMQQFIEKFGRHILGVVSGLDRLVFRGNLRRLNYGYKGWFNERPVFVARGMEIYCSLNDILFKDYADHVRRVTEQLKAQSLKPFHEQGIPVVFERDPKVDKEKLAREMAAKKGIEKGLMCAISALEPSPTFEHCGTHIIRRTRPSHVLYHYQNHAELGWMHARIQTWFPFNIQIAVNGREWLSRQMDKAGIKYRKQGNCFVWIEDYEQAQILLNPQLETNWADLLDGFAAQLNPIQESLFEKYPASYYWTSYQSEWATDVVFQEADDLRRLMPLLVRHAVLSHSCADVMRYFGRKVNQSGEIPANFSGVLQTDLKRRQEGERVKYRLNGNSAKFYDKTYSEVGSVFRAAETTITTGKDFRVYRPKEGGPEEELHWLPLRQGIADLHRRAEVSQKTNERLMNAMASVDDSRTVEELTTDIQKSVVWNKRRVRGLRPWGEDKPLLTAINHGEFLINGFRNRDLQALLYDTEATSDKERRSRSAAISRKLRMLRAHRLVQKVSRSNRYHVTEAGRVILMAVLTSARTSVHQLNQLVEAA
jgi:hypothetical protein